MTESKLSDSEPKWYILHVLTGQEEKVKRSLEQRVRAMDLEERVLNIVVPTEKQIEIRDGKKREVERKIFPGYILVEVKMDDKTWFAIRSTPGVTGFVSAQEKGGRLRPVPLDPKEVESIFQQMQSGTPRLKVGFSKGQSVRITAGPFADFIGTVDEILQDRGKVKVLVSFFGRETPVELDFLQVERI